MKKFISDMMAWYKERHDRRRQAALNAEAYHRIQLKEYDGAEYIAVDGYPLIDINEVKGKPTDVIEGMRDVFKQYREDGVCGR